MAYVTKLIGSGFRATQWDLYNRINDLEQQLKHVVEERLKNFYDMEEALKQEAVPVKAWHGDKIYILNQEGQDLYNKLESDSSVSNLELLEAVLAAPELFIVINYTREYIEYIGLKWPI